MVATFLALLDGRSHVGWDCVSQLADHVARLLEGLLQDVFFKQKQLLQHSDQTRVFRVEGSYEACRLA